MQIYRLLPISILILQLSFVSAMAAESGSWGDQGDGTYRNPILNADYPDVDVEQVFHYDYDGPKGG